MCLGPLLFTRYASKLFEVIKARFVHACADDTQFYLSFGPDSATSQIDAVSAMQDCLENIGAWMVVDRLKLNEDKTEIILIGTRQQLNKVSIAHLNIGRATVPIVRSAVRNLGLWFDCYLKMTMQINKICQSVLYHLHSIRQGSS